MGRGGGTEAMYRDLGSDSWLLGWEVDVCSRVGQCLVGITVTVVCPW